MEVSFMNSQLNEIWQLTLSELSKDLNKPSFETWFNLTKPVSLENDCLVIEVPNDFTKEWFETRYREKIMKALKEITASDHRVNFIIASEFQDSGDLIQQLDQDALNENHLFLSENENHNTNQKHIDDNFKKNKLISSFIMVK